MHRTRIATTRARVSASKRSVKNGPFRSVPRRTCWRRPASRKASIGPVGTCRRSFEALQPGCDPASRQRSCFPGKVQVIFKRCSPTRKGNSDAPVRGCPRDPLASRLCSSLRRVIPGYASVAIAARDDARKQRGRRFPSQDQHCITVAKEAITAANCLEVRLTDNLDSDQSTHKNQQTAPR